ncbi:putative Dolichol-phosphate mannosyltransferase homolog [Sulfolobales Virus YNP2]|uniref:putative Dolichol-phosphate mannosyltransferase homolog n=1 Tax=Sulfolobales Virus YNP2 TaxID=1732180 RepID=UPI00070603A5|nr:putative Dolichol-phosphate mannosyltransferase homolog [Sulfolobales Virus YNP2]ALG97195.1 putative Dolichol-phosphate mannosyltransferase homolog [Sulfolobales Virus YNP2]
MRYLQRLLKFAIVGGLGTILNEGVFVLSSEAIPIAVSLALAIEASVIFNFVLNDMWTFRDKRNGSFMERLVKFHASSYLGNVIQYLATLALLIYFLHFPSIYQALLTLFLDKYGQSTVSLLLSNFLGIIVGFMVRFATSLRYVWT